MLFRRFQAVRAKIAGFCAVPWNRARRPAERSPDVGGRPVRPTTAGGFRGVRHVCPVDRGAAEKGARNGPKPPRRRFFEEKAPKKQVSQLILFGVRGIVRTLLFLFDCERRHHDRDFRHTSGTDAPPECGCGPYRRGRGSRRLSSRAAEGAETAARILRHDVGAVGARTVPSRRFGRNDSEFTITTSKQPFHKEKHHEQSTDDRT